VATPQVFTDDLVRLTRCLDFVKRAVAMNDDVFDFFYEALPGYEEVGRRRTLLGCWGAFQDPEVVDYDYRTMDEWGNAMFVTPGVIIDNDLVTTNLVDINLQMRILLGSSYYEDWTNEETFVDKDPLGNPVDRRPPWNQTTCRRRRSAIWRAGTAGSSAPGGTTGVPVTTSPWTPVAGRSPGCGPLHWPARFVPPTSAPPGRAWRSTCRRLRRRRRPALPLAAHAQAAAGGRAIDEVLWAGLGIPVDLAFFSRSEVSGEVSVGYPSPLGTMWPTVEPQRWREVEASHPALSIMVADVEAQLVNRADGARENWLVPLDDCYRLVAVVRAKWKGLGGGPEVRQHVDNFFSELSDYPPSTEEGPWPESS
jgi:hypothetical protein